MHFTNKKKCLAQFSKLIVYFVFHLYCLIASFRRHADVRLASVNTTQWLFFIFMFCSTCPRPSDSWLCCHLCEGTTAHWQRFLNAAWMSGQVGPFNYQGLKEMFYRYLKFYQIYFVCVYLYFVYSSVVLVALLLLFIGRQGHLLSVHVEMSCKT